MSKMPREVGLPALIFGCTLAALVTAEPEGPAPRSGVTTVLRATPSAGASIWRHSH
jgi:hypothetical protein